MAGVSTINQNLDQARKSVEKAFKKNPRRSFSALFRKLRKREDVWFFGDYALMALICDEASNEGISPSDKVIGLMCRQSSEYRSLAKRRKMIWNRNLYRLFK